jgi:hypothetical protein
MPGNDLLQNYLSWYFEALLYIIEKLTDQDRRGARAVILDALADVADEQSLPGRKEGFQE